MIGRPIAAGEQRIAYDYDDGRYLNTKEYETTKRTARATWKKLTICFDISRRKPEKHSDNA